MTDEINLTDPATPPAGQGPEVGSGAAPDATHAQSVHPEAQQAAEPPPQTPLGPIPVGKVQTQTFRRKDGSTVQRTVRVINPHTDSKYAK